MVRALGRAAAWGAVLLVVGALTGCGEGGSGGPRPSSGATSSPSPSPSPSASPTATPSAVPTPTGPPVHLEPLGTFTAPVWVGPVPGDPQHLFLAQRNGTVLRLDAAGHQVGVVLTLTRQVGQGNEQGLLSLAFDPSYQRTHRFYVDYTDQDGSILVAAYTVVNGVAERPQRLLTVAHPRYRNHNGGLLLVDRSGALLVGTGDGGNAGDPDNLAQDPQSLLGKILRIDPTTGGPAPGNPYPQNRYVWALGLRNPWRGSFGPGGELYLGDLGQNKLEELDVVPAALQRGANFGWSVYEGDRRFKEDAQLTPGGPVILPALTYSHTEGDCAVTAGEVYRGRALPWLQGRFLFGDYCRGHVVAVTRTRNGIGSPVDLGIRVQGLQSFGHDARGELLALSFDTLFRLAPGA